MKTVYKLDQKDIQQIIANYYNCDKDKVELICGQTCVGYGLMEHMVGTVRAEVEVINNQ